MTQHSRRLLRQGAILFAFALVVGLTIPGVAVPRLALAAHVNGLVGSLFLMVLGLVWPRLDLGNRQATVAFGSAVYSLWMVTLVPLLGAFWNAGSSVLPMAAGAATGSALQEGVLGAALASAVLAVLILAGLLVFGLRGGSERG